MTTLASRFAAISVLLPLLCATAGPVQAAPVTSLAQGQTGPIEFTSITPTNIAEFVKKQTTATVTITAKLTLPAGATGKVPAMILAHHCGGITTTVTNLATMLNGLGIATFVPDSFTARGYPSGVCTGSTLNNTVAIADALYALKLLATHPNIDASRIGIIGQSYGGGAVYTTAFEEARRAVIDDSLKFAAHIALYPTGCSSRYWSDNMTGAPILSLLGALDDWTPAGPCKDFALLMRSKGTPTTTIVYPNARHAWDSSPNYFKQDTNWTSLENCYWQYRMDLLQSSLYDGSGRVFTDSPSVTSYINSCKKYGATQGGDATTKTAAEADIAGFLARVFKLTNVALPASQPDRIFNYLETAYPSYLAPAGAASQTASGYYFRHYPTTNSYLATNGDGQVYYYAPGSTASPLPIGGEAAWLNTAGQHDF